MSTYILQKVMTRLLFDHHWVSRVYQNPEGELSSLDLSLQEKEWILQTDPRRWSIDDQRPHRALEGLVRLCPVSLACWTSVGGQGQHCLEFFSHPIFHTTIQEGHDLIEGFWDWFTLVVKQNNQIQAQLDELM